MSSQPDSNTFFAIPDAYDDFMGRFSRPLAQQFVQSIPLTAGDRVLDLGCGTGTLTELLSQKGFDMIGVDSSEEMLQLAMDKKEKTGSRILYLC